MPIRPGRPCPGRGPRRGSCPNVIRGPGVCPACQPYEKAIAKEYDTRRGNSGERGYDAQWQQVREMKLNRDPLCEVHLKRDLIAVAATLVHHIRPIEQHPELRLVMENLMSLCAACHEEIHTGKSRWGR